MPALNRRRSAAAFGLALLLALALLFLLPSQPAPRYTITDLGVLPGDIKSGAFAVSSQGTVSGYTQAISKQACIFQGGKVTSIGVLPVGMESFARDINAQGAVTGDLGLSPTRQAFVYRNGIMHTLGTLPGFSASEGLAINAGGEVAGRAMNPTLRPGSSFEHAFFYSHGKMIDLAASLGGCDSQASSINSAGQVAGDYYPSAGRVRFAPFLYESRRRTVTALSMPTPDIYGHANHVNDRGQVVGSISAGGVTHAAFWSGGHLTDLGTPPGYDDTSAEGLNNRGEAVGRCFLEDSLIHTFLQRHAGSGNPWQRYLDRDTSGAFLYRDGKMQDLNALIPADAGWKLEEAHSINDLGQITGKGLHSGQERAFLLTPK